MGSALAWAAIAHRVCARSNSLLAAEITDPLRQSFRVPGPRAAVPHGQAALHRNRRLPDEHARQRAGRGQPAQGRATSWSTRRPRPTRSCSTPAASASMPRTRSTAPWAGCKHAKKHNPHKIIGVLGCMAQKDQQLIFERAPYVDLVVGPGQLHQIPELIDEDRRRRRAADGSQPRPQRRQPRRDRAELRELRSAARSDRCGRRRFRPSCGS